jgi:Domain of unknown function (DUF4157)
VSDPAGKARQAAPTQAPGARVGQSVAPVAEPPGVHAATAFALQRNAGNRAVAELVRTSVPRQAVQRCACAAGGGKCAKCQREEQEVLRRSAEPGAPPAPEAAGGVVQSVISGPGHPLEAGVRREMEAQFGVSLGGVRVHTDGAAAASAAAVAARAYTVGKHIVFGASTYAPGTPAGRHLLAHELAHTIQQRGAASGVQRLTIDPGGRTSSAEREAEAAAASVARGADVAPLHQMPASLQRFYMSSEKAGGCGICSEVQFGAGWQKKVGQRAHTIVQAAARAAARFTQNALMQSELPITQKGKSKRPKFLPPITSKRDKDNGRLDLAVPTPTGFAIAEIKPSTEPGEREGLLDLEYYEKIIRQRYPDATVERLKLAIPLGVPFPDKLAISAGCTPQLIAAMLMQPGLIGYWCTPPYSEARSKCSCKKKKKKSKKKEKKKQDKKTKKKKDTKQSKKKTDKKGPKKTGKPKAPKAKGANISLGIGINSSGGGAGNIGVGISVNTHGFSAGTAGATATYDVNGNVIGGVGVGAAARSEANIAAGAGVTAADKSSSTGAAVAAVGTAEEVDTLAAGAASKGHAKNVQGKGVGVATSGDVKDVTVTEAQSGKASEEGEAGKSKTEGGKPETGEGAATGPGPSPGPTGDIRDTPGFKQAQEEGKRVEATLAGATPAQKKLIAELVKRYPEDLLPIPNEGFAQKWLNATAHIRVEHVAKLADAGWTPATDIDEAEFKRQVDEVIAGKRPVGELWTSPEPPPKPQPSKQPPAKKDPDAGFRGIEAPKGKDPGEKPGELRARLQKQAREYDFSRVTDTQGLVDPKSTAEQTTTLYLKSKYGNAACLAVIRLSKDKDGDYVKVLKASDAVTVEGKVFHPNFIGKRVPVRIR